MSEAAGISQTVLPTAGGLVHSQVFNVSTTAYFRGSYAATTDRTSDTPFIWPAITRFLRLKCNERFRKFNL